MIEGLGSVRLEVKDLKRSLTFYCDGLRFDLDDRQDGEPSAVALRAGGLRLVLAQRRAGRSQPGAIELSVQVAGVDAYYDALVARGMHPNPPSDGQAKRSFTVRDPDGVIWRFEQSLA